MKSIIVDKHLTKGKGGRELLEDVVERQLLERSCGKRRRRTPGVNLSPRYA